MKSSTSKFSVFLILFSLASAHGKPTDLFVDSSAVVSMTSDTFVCVTVDWWPPDKCDYKHCTWAGSTMLNLDLKNQKLHEALELFAPFILRIGGSLQDLIVYNVGGIAAGNCGPMRRVSWRDNRIGFRGGCLNMSRWDEINNFCTQFGCRIAFGLNGLYGRKQESFKQWSGAWDSSNSKSLIEYSKQKNFPIHSWQFGNELAGPGGIQCQISAKQYAADTMKLREIIDTVYRNSWHRKPKLATPDSYFDLAWMRAYFSLLPLGTVDIATFHNYYLGPGDFPNLMSRVVSTEWSQGNSNSYVSTENAMRVLCPGCKVWMGESGGAFNSGQHSVTNSFASGFWYLDSLGLAALHNYEVFCRQTLIGGSYSLLSPVSFSPNPDFFSATFFKRIMGRKVFKAHLFEPAPVSKLRVYVHCQRKVANSPVTRVGLAVLIINFNPKFHEFLKLTLLQANATADFLGGSRREYHFTNKHLSSQSVWINGVEANLEMLRRPSSLAETKGANDVIEMKPLSYGFFVFNQANIRACSTSG